MEALFTAVLSERTRMARELHDTLAQGFAGIAIHLDAAVASLPKGVEDVRAHLTLARTLVRDSLAEARRSVLDLRPQALESGDLATAISEMAGRLAADPPIDVQVTGRARRLPNAVESHLLRIAQEALTNALRHAHAREISLQLHFAHDQVSLRVQDDGQGLDDKTGEPASVAHLGLAGIRERVAQMGGHLTLHSRPGCGTEVVVKVPVLSPSEPRAGVEGRRTH
jgi:signal transduction histidine kinase